MKIGDKVRIVKCDACSKIVGKMVSVTEVTTIDGCKGVKVNFGRGRPQLGRPDVFGMDEVSSMEDEPNEDSCS